MVLSSQEVYASIFDPLAIAKQQQHGVDLTIREIKTLHYANSTGVFIDRTQPAPEHVLEPMVQAGDKYLKGWNLAKGVYSIYFDQGVSVPEDCKANIIHRSSVARCGGQIYSGEYDPGYKTEFMGAFLVVHDPFFIEEHSRVAQIVMYRIGGEVPTYNGQWQGGYPIGGLSDTI